MKKMFLTCLACMISVVAVQAEECCLKKEKFHGQYYVGANVGVNSVLNDGFNKPNLNFNVQFGKEFTPIFGARLNAGGLWQSLGRQETGYENDRKLYGEFDLDATVNLFSLFGNKNYKRPFNLYLFVGPTFYLSKAVNMHVGYSDVVTKETPIISIDENGNTYNEGTLHTEDADAVLSFPEGKMKTRVGASVGLGASYKFNKHWGMNLEARYSVAPSIFGFGSDCRYSEGVGRVNLGVTYAFGGKKEDDKPCDYMLRTQSQLRDALSEVDDLKGQLAEANAKSKEVEKVVEYKIDNKGMFPFTILFKLDDTKVLKSQKVNLTVLTDFMKKNPDQKYIITGYADVQTATPNYNQKLSEKRAQSVLKVLTEEYGIPASRLQTQAKGGVDVMYFNDNKLSRCVIITIAE